MAKLKPKNQNAEKPVKEKSKRRKTIKVFYKGTGLMDRVKLFQKNKHNFELSFTGYTAVIKSETLKTTFIYVKENSKQNFELANKLKSEIKSKDIHIDAINKSNIKYFSINRLNPVIYKTVYNVDINSAYPKALINLGLISKDLFNELQSVSKAIKLKSIGQLATNKTIYVFNKGEQVSFYHKTDEQLRNVWFALCNEVGEAIEECKNNCNTFLFYWFDGIYFTDKNEADKLIEILAKRNFESKLEILKDFIVSETEDFIKVKYQKKDGEKNFKLPKSETVNYG